MRSLTPKVQCAALTGHFAPTTNLALAHRGAALPLQAPALMLDEGADLGKQPVFQFQLTPRVPRTLRENVGVHDR